jgi:hypothetical protein
MFILINYNASLYCNFRNEKSGLISLIRVIRIPIQCCKAAIKKISVNPLNPCYQRSIVLILSIYGDLLTAIVAGIFGGIARV